MFGLGWAEILVAAVVGLIVIGPKELPVVFRKIGQFVGKAKAMARDFSRAMNDAADDAGVKDASGFSQLIERRGAQRLGPNHQVERLRAGL